jgi:transposase
MRPSSWHPPLEPSSVEQTIITRIKRAKVFVCLRYHRHEFFNDLFQEELTTLSAPRLRGQPPIPPAQ